MFAAFRKFDEQGVTSLGLTSATLDARLRDIGFLPRWIFASNIAVNDYLGSRNDKRPGVRVSVVKKESSLRVPGAVGRLQADAGEPGYDLNSMNKKGDSCELLEAPMQYAGLMVNDDGLGDFVEERCRLPRWRWYHDPGDQPLTQQHALGKGKQDQELLRQLVTGTKVCERVRLLDGVHMSRNVWELEEGVLYESTLPNVALVVE
eukprot:gene41955-51214_t